MEGRALLFELGGEALAIPASASREAFVPGALTPLPGGAGVLLGLAAVRGGSAPLIDLSALLGLSAPRPGLALLTEVAGEALAFPVQRVLGFAGLPAEFAATPPEGLLSAPLAVSLERGSGSVRRLHLEPLLRQLRARLAPLS